MKKLKLMFKSSILNVGLATVAINEILKLFNHGSGF